MPGLRRFRCVWWASPRLPRGAFDQEHFLAIDLETCAGMDWLPGFGPYDHLHSGRGSGGIRCGATVDQVAQAALAPQEASVVLR